jgi:OPA family glycerol-3-phosphate transporter-like MFS transporter
MNAIDERKQRMWQYRIFTLLWTGYASYYLCRLNFSVAQPALMADFDWTSAQVGGIPSVYATFYAIGQFVNGQLADRFGPRRMMTTALSVAVLCNIGMAFADSYTMMLVLWAINGYAQSAGWTLVVQTAANWSKVERRGAILGVISTCYAVGNVLAWLLAGFLVDGFGWRFAFAVPAFIALPVAIAIGVFLRNDPRDAGLPRIRDDILEEDEVGDDGEKRAPIGTFAMLKLTLSNPILWVLALGFFCNNSVRYAFMNWAVQYMADFHGRSITGSAMMAVALPLIGALGAMSAGWISDTVFGKRRAPVCAIALGLLALLCVAFVQVPQGQWQIATVMLGVAGFLIYGPDMLMSGAATIDFAHPRAAAAATGFTMATGAAGSIFSGAGVGWLRDTTGGEWDLVFYVLAGLSLIPALLMLTIWNAKPKGS